MFENWIFLGENMNNENTNLHDYTTIQNNQGDIIGVGVYGDSNIIAKNIRVDNLIVDLRSFGLELLHPDYFKQHDNVEENVEIGTEVFH